MIRVNSYHAPPKAFAPYNYILKHITDLHERYTELARNTGSQDYLETPTFGPLSVHICCDTTEQKPVDIQDVVPKGATKLCPESGHYSLRSFLESSEVKTTNYVSVVVLNEDFKGLEEISTLEDLCENVIFILVVYDMNKLKENDKTFKASGISGGNVHYTLKEKINTDIGDMLERKVLQTIKVKCENVSEWLRCLKERTAFGLDQNSQISNGGKWKRKAFAEAESRIKGSSNTKRFCFEKNNPIAGPSRELPVLDALNTCHDATCQRGNCRGNSSIFFSADERCVSTHVNSDVQLASTELLLAEMLALYSTSNVPEQDRPNICISRSTPISEKVKAEIFRLNPTVKGMGYRFSRFIIYIEETKHTKAERNLEKRIKETLNKHGILEDEYKIEFVSKEVEHYACDVKVGSRLMTHENVFRGTLGCFAYMKKNNVSRRCALLSKHVANFSRRFNYSSDSSLGHIIRATLVDTGLDIAAMSLEGHIRCCASFRIENIDMGDENEVDTLDGKLYHYVEDQEADTSGILRQGQRVYIWGGVSHPGKGVITMCDYKCDDMKALIQIEDRVPKEGESSESFCDPGDSGAIVCAEDSRGRFVHLIGMLIGEIVTENDSQDSKKCIRKYLALPLSCGLEELNERTGSTFEIFQLISE